jgi:uncharacterized membrane protein YhhN
MIGLWFVRLFFIFYLLLVLLGYTDIAFYFKPLLVPSLLLLFAANKFEYLYKKLVIALFFSTLGDIFLLCEGSLFFILGLSSFLIAHLAYISIFYELTKPVFFKGIYTYLLFGLLIYEFILLQYLWPNLEGMKAPVLIYATTICVMLWVSLLLFRTNKSKGSILSMRLFIDDFEYAQFWVMCTYLLAQYLIVSGLLMLFKKNSKSILKL